MFHRPWCYPFAECDIMDQHVQTWIADGFIEPSKLENSSQVIILEKKGRHPKNVYRLS